MNVSLGTFYNQSDLVNILFVFMSRLIIFESQPNLANLLFWPSPYLAICCFC